MRIRRLARVMMSMLHNMKETLNQSHSGGSSYSLLSTSNDTNYDRRKRSRGSCCSRFSLYRGIFAQHIPPLICLPIMCLLLSLPEEDRFQFDLLMVILLVVFFFNIVYFIESFFTFAPNVPDLSRFLVEMPQDSHFPVWRVVRLKAPSLGSGGDVVLKSFLILQEDPAKRVTAPTVLFIHGNAGNIGHRLPMAKILYDTCGVNIFLLEYRGYGYSNGLPNEAGICADAKIALDYLTSGANGDINGRNIFVFGRSIGGAIVIDLCTQAGISTNVRGVILENTFTSIPGMGVAIARNMFGPLGRLCLPTGLVHNRFDSLKKLKKCTLDEDLKFLFISGSKDDLVPPQMMKELAETWAVNTGKAAEAENTWNFESPKDFIDRGNEGLVRFEGGNHGTTWTCDGFNDVLKHFITLHQAPANANN